jgi:hypothetical protein
MQNSIVQQHKTMCENLNRFVAQLPVVNIKFLFFFSNTLDKPVVATLFSEYKDWYIAPGRDSNYWYAYRKNDVKYLVSDYQVDPRKSPIVLYNVLMKRKTHTDAAADDENEAYLGHHIDFSIHKSRQQVFYKTHWTRYTDTSGSDFFFTRSTDQTCNFVVASQGAVKSYADFVKETKCVQGAQNVPICNIDQMYTEGRDTRLLYDFCSAASKEMGLMQAGGAPLPDVAGQKKYKNMTPLSQEFIKFVADTLLRPLIKKLERFDYCVYEYFDIADAHGGCKSIQYVIECEEDQVAAVAISTHRALKACWASLNVGSSSEKEKKCLRQWRECCADVLKSISV